MHLRPDSLLFGVEPTILVDCAGQLRNQTLGFSLEDFCEAIGAPMREAEPVLRLMIDGGYIATKRESLYVPTQKLGQLALASVSVGLTRAEAELLLQRIIFKAAEVNAHPDEYPSSVTCLVVFGSYLTAKDHLGDLDVGVELAEARRTRALKGGGGIREIFTDRFAAANKSLAALRLRKPKVISLHPLRDVLDLNTPYRVVFGAMPAARY